MLSKSVQAFNNRVAASPELQIKLRAITSPIDFLSLAQECSIQISEDELQQAVLLAEAIPGFSFEKLWFRGLGLLE